MPSAALPWVLVLLAGVNSTIGNLLLKQSRAGHAAMALTDQMRSPWFLGGLFFYAINVLLFARALDRLPVSTAYPVLATTGFLLLAGAGAIVFGERLNVAQWCGMALALAGIVLVARG
jgi:multidrug transporter EmrE-like cation transporter